MGFDAPRPVGSSQIRDRTHISCPACQVDFLPLTIREAADLFLKVRKQAQQLGNLLQAFYLENCEAETET